MEMTAAPIDRPGGPMALIDVAKLFVEEKKPTVDITRLTVPAFQTRKYGRNVNHEIAVLMSFEYLVMYDICYSSKEKDG